MLTTIIYSQNSNDLKLWYDEPSGDIWENALPIGNGRIGAMVYGNVTNEVFQLNEHTVWSGSPNRNDNPDALEALPKVRELIFKGEYKKAEQLANDKIITKKSISEGNFVMYSKGLLKCKANPKRKDFFKTDKQTEGTLHMCFNPPYGERLDIDLENFYSAIGDTLKHNYPGSTAWLITSDTAALKSVGLRTSKRIALKNGDLDCKFVKYELYEGSRKIKKL